MEMIFGFLFRLFWEGGKLLFREGRGVEVGFVFS